MRLLAAALVASAVIAAGATGGRLRAQARDGFVERFDHPAIDYYAGSLNDPVANLERALTDGRTRLAYEPGAGYLASLLRALDISTDSQVVVFSQTSFQASRITPKNPRAIYFNDQVAVGYVRGGEVLEIAAEDARRGVVFYSLEQRPSAKPAFARRRECLRCHVSWDTLGVPGLVVLSTGPADSSGYASGGVVDQRSRIADRWGSWYVTGRMVPMHSMGVALPTLEGQFDLSSYLAPSSDVVALTLLEHQTRMTNLLTDIGWEGRVGADDRRLESIARELVDYMLFVNEAPLGGKIEGSSGFAQRFSAIGPRDRHGRSLREFDLQRRLMKYPCSYMIYTPTFDALPSNAKAAIYARMWQVLSGEDKTAKYARLSAADREAVVEILRETKKDLPQAFRAHAVTSARDSRSVPTRLR